MNKAHRAGTAIILKQLEAEEMPVIPLNRHQRRAARKVKK